MKITWVTLRVSDLEKSTDFYKNRLGLPLDREFGTDEQKIVFFGAGDSAKIELIWSKNGEKLANVGKGVSIGLDVSDLDYLVAELSKAGVTAEGPFSPSPAIRFYFVSDPDGYQIQLCQNAD